MHGRRRVCCASCSSTAACLRSGPPPAVGLGEEKDLEALLRQKEELTRERDAQVEQIVALRNEVGAAAAGLSGD